MDDSYVENRLNQIGLSEIDFDKRKREKKWKAKCDKFQGRKQHDD